MTTNSSDKRAMPRFDVLEFANLWRNNGSGPEKLGGAVITNASLGGVQLYTKEPVQAEESLMLEVATEDGVHFIKGDIRYSGKNGDEQRSAAKTLGFRFSPSNRSEREVIAKFVIGLSDRMFAGV